MLAENGTDVPRAAVSVRVRMEGLLEKPDMIRVKRIGEHTLPLPKQHTAGAAGFDLHTLNPNFVLYPQEIQKVRTGFAWEIPLGYVGMTRDRSSTGSKGLHVITGTIDNDYRGELIVTLANVSDEELLVEFGTRIAQLLIVAALFDVCEEVVELSKTERGEKGFGSTGQ